MLYTNSGKDKAKIFGSSRKVVEKESERIEKEHALIHT